MKRYDAYKDSGIEWIGEIPEGWNIVKIKHICRLKTGHTPPSNVVKYFNGSIRWYTPGDLNNNVLGDSARHLTQQALDENEAPLYPAQTTLLVGIGNVGRVGFSMQECSSNQQITALISDFCYPKWLFYIMQNEELKLRALALFTIVPIMNNEYLGNHKIMVPSIDEQEKIASYLDKKTFQIDSLTEKTERSIELLEEYRKSVISEAVTKGLNPNAPMKDSGVEWIGKIPEGWVCQKIKYLSKVIRGGSPRPIEHYLSDDDNGYNWIKIGDANKGSKYIKGTSQRIIEEGLSKTRMVHKGDLILSNSMSFGQPYILGIDGCIHDGWVSLSKSEVLPQEFMYYALMSEATALQFAVNASGGVVQNLNIEKIENTFIPFPNIEECERITHYLDQKTSEIDSLIKKKKQVVEKLQEYRKSLISECVTGKIKVPGV